MISIETIAKIEQKPKLKTEQKVKCDPDYVMTFRSMYINEHLPSRTEQIKRYNQYRKWE